MKQRQNRRKILADLATVQSNAMADSYNKKITIIYVGKRRSKNSRCNLRLCGCVFEKFCLRIDAHVLLMDFIK